MRRELRADINRRRSITGADDRDCDGVELFEIQRQGEQQRKEYAKLSGGAEQNDLGILQQRLKVGHGANADENQQRKNFREHTGIIKKTQEAFFAHHISQRYIDENRAKANGYEKQRFVALFDAEVEKHTSDRQHDHLTDADICDAQKQTLQAGSQRGFHQAILTFLDGRFLGVVGK